MFVRMIDVFEGRRCLPPDKSRGYRMIDVSNKKLLNLKNTFTGVNNLINGTFFHALSSFIELMLTFCNGLYIFAVFF
jgi:hypothetical protein